MTVTPVLSFWMSDKSQTHSIFSKMEFDDSRDAIITNLSSPLKVLNDNILSPFGNMPQLAAVEFCSNNPYFLQMEEPRFQQDGKFCYHFFPFHVTHMLNWSHRTTIFSHLPHIIQQLSDCLEQIHSNHIVHGMFYPTNIRYNEISKKIQVCVYPQYLRPKCNEGGCTNYVFSSPENIWFHKLNPANDVWSLGIMIIALLMGRFPRLQTCTEHVNSIEYRDALDKVYTSLGAPLQNNNSHPSPSCRFKLQQFYSKLRLTAENLQTFEEMDKDLIDLIEQMLDINHYTRITATQIKSHPYLTKHKLPDNEFKCTPNDAGIPIYLHPLKDRDTILDQLYTYTLEMKLEHVFVLAVSIWDRYLSKLDDLTEVNSFQIGQVCLKLAINIVSHFNIYIDNANCTNQFTEYLSISEKKIIMHIYTLLEGKLYQHTFDYLVALQNSQIEYSVCLSIIKRKDFYKNNANYWERKLVVQLFDSQHPKTVQELSSTTALPQDLLNLVLEYYLL